MNELRMVIDGAEIQICEAQLSVTPSRWFRFKGYKESDTIPIQSEWDAEQVAVLCGITKNGWDIILSNEVYERWYHQKMQLCRVGQNYDWSKVDSIARSQFLHELISLSIAHKASGLSLEDFIKGMKEYK